MSLSKKCINCGKTCKRQFEDENENCVLSIHWSCQGVVQIDKGTVNHGCDKYVVQCRGITAKKAVNAIKAVLKEYCNSSIHKKAYKEVAKHDMKKYAVVYYSGSFLTYFVPSLRRYIDAMCITVRELILGQVCTVGLIFHASNRVKGLPRVKQTKTGKRRKIKIPILDVNFPPDVVNLIYEFAFPNILPVDNSGWHWLEGMLDSCSVVERVAKHVLSFMALKEYGYRPKILKKKLKENVQEECNKYLFKKKGKFRLV